MKTLKLITPIIAITLCFTTCKRYPEGGWTNVAIKHLFGGHKTGSSKIWHLKKYEVNGIDSTIYVTPGNGYTSFVNDEYTFRVYDYNKNEFYGKSKTYGYTIVWGNVRNIFENKKKEIGILVGNVISGGPRELQCKDGICERNIFNPNFKNLHLVWKIQKLKSNILIITTEDNGILYKIIFSI